MDKFDLGEYLSNGVEKIVKGAIKASFTNPKESIFLAKYAVSAKKAAEQRAEAEKRGEHIPPFLIASITNKCNLHCAGCYARANHACNDDSSQKQLSADWWGSIFLQAQDMGCGFILLAGGEPLVRRDIIEKAAEYRRMIFPVFTNGTLLNDEYIGLFDNNRNLVPILSIEGNREKTDGRRGSGIYDVIEGAMERLKKQQILFGASVTVTSANAGEAVSDDFLSKIHDKGCKVVIYVEYVPVNENTRELAFNDSQRESFARNLAEVREKYDDMVFISFPGDEKTSGGCLAAGRGFFHINSMGGAEPCPFSPYSDTSLTEMSLRDALRSPLFRRLQEGDFLMEEHDGGCVLFGREDTVKELLKKENA